MVSANHYDGTTATKHWNKMLCNNELLPNIKLIFADGTFGGTFRKEMEEKHNIGVVIPDIQIAQKGKVKIHEKRWIVERTIAWTLNNRRCSKDYSYFLRSTSMKEKLKMPMRLLSYQILED